MPNFYIFFLCFKNYYFNVWNDLFMTVTFHLYETNLNYGLKCKIML